jgi:DNA-binding transcriptional MerR regulator
MVVIRRPMAEYTTADVARVSRVPLRKVISYIERGYIVPSIQDAAGHGSKRLWNSTDLVRCLLIGYLQANLSADFVRSLAESVADETLVGPECSWEIILPEEGAGKVDPVVRFSSDEMDAGGVPEVDRTRHPATLLVSFRVLHGMVSKRLG